MVRSRRFARDESGQTTIEYILLLAVLVSLFGLVMRGLNQANLAQTMLKPITQEYAYVYRYGHKDARGFDDGGPTMHPRFVTGGNFRIFINPEYK